MSRYLSKFWETTVPQGRAVPRDFGQRDSDQLRILDTLGAANADSPAVAAFTKQAIVLGLGFPGTLEANSVLFGLGGGSSGICVRTTDLESLVAPEPGHYLGIAVSNPLSMPYVRLLIAAGYPLKIYPRPDSDAVAGPQGIVSEDNAWNWFNDGEVQAVDGCDGRAFRLNPQWSDGYATPVVYWGDSPPNYPATVDASRLDSFESIVRATSDQQVQLFADMWTAVPPIMSVFVVPGNMSSDYKDSLAQSLRQTLVNCWPQEVLDVWGMSGCTPTLMEGEEVVRWANSVRELSSVDISHEVLGPFYTFREVVSFLEGNMPPLPYENPSIAVDPLSSSDWSVVGYKDSCWKVEFQWQYAYGDSAKRIDTYVVDELGPGLAVTSEESNDSTTAPQVKSSTPRASERCESVVSALQ